MAYGGGGVGGRVTGTKINVEGLRVQHQWGPMTALGPKGQKEEMVSHGK